MNTKMSKDQDIKDNSIYLAKDNLICNALQFC